MGTHSATRTIRGLATLALVVVALLMMLLAVEAASADASTGGIEVSGYHFTFHARSTNECPSNCGWYAAAYMAREEDCANASELVGVSGSPVDTTQGESELTFSGSVTKDHIGAYEVCLFVYGSGNRELVASNPYSFPAPSGTIGGVFDRHIPFQAGEELEVSATVVEPYTGPFGWSWITALAALPGQTPCPTAQPQVGAYAWVSELAISVGQELKIVPPVTSGTLTFCLYIDISNAPEEGHYLVAEKPYTFPTVPGPPPKAAPETPKPAPPAPKYKPLTLSTAKWWSEHAVRYHFHYAPSGYRAKCSKQSGHYRCTASWHHSQYVYTGTVEIGQLNMSTGRYTYGLRVTRTNSRNHERETITVRY